MKNKKKTTKDFEEQGTRLRQLRKEAGLRQSDVAETIGCKLRSYANYENGIRLPPTELLLGLTKLYNVSCDYLLCKTDFRSGVQGEYLSQLTGLSDEALQVLVADHADVSDRLSARNDGHLSIQGYSASPEDFQGLADILTFLLSDGRADMGSGGLLDLLRAYFTTPDNATIDGITDGITSAGRRGFHLTSGQVAAGMYFAQIQQILTRYRDALLQRKKAP